MKVLLTHERFAPDMGGGGEYVVLRAAQHLMRQGIGVDVLTTGPADLTVYEGVSTTRLPVHRYRFNLAVRKIIAMARDKDLIQTFNYQAILPSWLAGKVLGKPVVCMNLGVYGRAWKEMRGPVVGRAIMMYEKFLVTRGFARSVFLSEYSLDRAVELGALAGRCRVIKVGIDLEKYVPADPKEHVILYAGKFDKRKGIYDVLTAARSLPRARFRVMGWGPGEREVRKAAPGNVEFVAFESGAPLRDAFSRASVFVLPSKAEGFPIALLEAMASGCAVVSTLPLEYAGEQVPQGDLHKLTDAIARLWDDPARVSAQGRRNRELAESYTWEQFSATLQCIYTEVLNEAGRGKAETGGY